jgi:hypothetical protein
VSVVSPLADLLHASATRKCVVVRVDTIGEVLVYLLVCLCLVVFVCEWR